MFSSLTNRLRYSLNWWKHHRSCVYLSEQVTITTEAFSFYTSSPSLSIEVAICKITEKINKTFNSKRLCKYSVVNFIIHEFAILFSSSPYILGKEKWTKFISFEINYEIDSRGNKQTFVLLVLLATSWYFCNSKVQKSAGSPWINSIFVN